MESEMDLILNDFEDHLTFNKDDDIEKNKDKNYYLAKGEYLLKQLENKENYFHFLSSILKNFKYLSEDKKIFLKETMCIQDQIKIVEKEKIIYKEKKIKKQKINNYEDY